MNLNNILLTKEGYEDLQKELEILKSETLPHIVSELQEARSMGDLSENGMYTAMREKQSLAQGRIYELEDILKRATIADNNKNYKGKKVVDLGSKVVLESSKHTVEYSIVGVEEVDMNAGKISHQSPIGQALMGKESGEEIEVNVPIGKLKYKIIDIK
jgi:transcription elongation factor GreA